MILESNGLSLIIPEEKPQDLLLRLKSNVNMTMNGNYFGAAYGEPDYEISVTGVIKSREILNLTQDFLENINANDIFYTDHHDVRWLCSCNPDAQTVRRRGRQVWTLSLRLIGTVV